MVVVVLSVRLGRKRSSGSGRIPSAVNLDDNIVNKSSWKSLKNRQSAAIMTSKLLVEGDSDSSISPAPDAQWITWLVILALSGTLPCCLQSAMHRRYWLYTHTRLFRFHKLNPSHGENKLDLVSHTVFVAVRNNLLKFKVARARVINWNDVLHITVVDKIPLNQ